MSVLLQSSTLPGGVASMKFPLWSNLLVIEKLGLMSLWVLCNLGSIVINVIIIFTSSDCSLLYFLPGWEYLWKNIICEVKNM